MRSIRLGVLGQQLGERRPHGPMAEQADAEAPVRCQRTHLSDPGATSRLIRSA